VYTETRYLDEVKTKKWLFYFEPPVEIEVTSYPVGLISIAWHLDGDKMVYGYGGTMQEAMSEFGKDLVRMYDIATDVLLGAYKNEKWAIVLKKHIKQLRQI